MSIEIIPVWKQVTPELQGELVDFWISNKAIVEVDVAAQRARQAVCIIRTADGAIVGVSTAYPKVLPRLRQPMYYYRNFIAAEFRGQQLGAPFLLKSRAVLQEYNQSLDAPECIGVLLELENRSLAMHRNEAHWDEVGFTFIGYSPKGLHLRVSYFDGARLLEPPSLRHRRGMQRQAGLG